MFCPDMAVCCLVSVYNWVGMVTPVRCEYAAAGCTDVFKYWSIGGTATWNSSSFSKCALSISGLMIHPHYIKIIQTKYLYTALQKIFTFNLLLLISQSLITTIIYYILSSTTNCITNIIKSYTGSNYIKLQKQRTKVSQVVVLNEVMKLLPNENVCKQRH